MYKYIILGAGPAGLAFANRLMQLGEYNFLVVEALNEAGGLCRSKTVDGSPLDIGGGHFLDVRSPKVNEFLFEFMPENEWDIYERNSQISIHGQFINHPFEANIWQLNTEEQIGYLKSIAKAGSNNGDEKPSDFIDWIYWKLGEKIAEDYMLPYNKKMFGEDLNQLGTYWMEKLPSVSFEDTLRSCLTKKAYAVQPGHAKFYYPRVYGYGELWLRMAKQLDGRIVYNEPVQIIDFEKREVITKSDHFNGKYIITTIPWKSIKILQENLLKQVEKLRHSSVQIEYFCDNLDTDAHWIYYPEQEIPYHRILVRHNFCRNSRGYWTETNKNRVQAKTSDTFTYLNEYAYPLNTVEKPVIMDELLNYAKKYGVFGLGRWGEHQHYNSDLTVELAMKMANELAAD